MFVCGGSDDLLQRLLGRRDSGAELAHPRRQALPRRGRAEEAAAAAAAPWRRRRSPAGRPAACWGCALPPPTPSFWKHAWIAAASAAVGGLIWRRMSSCWPPVLIFATIFGTTPSWWTAESTRPFETAATPGSDAIFAVCFCGNVSCVPGRKKSWTKCVPGLPSFERSVTADWFASISLAAAAAAAEAAGVLLRRQRHGEIRSDRRERIERGLLRAVEPARETADRDHERDAEREPDKRENRARSATEKLAAQIAEIEHLRSEPQRSKTELRLTAPSPQP